MKVSIRALTSSYFASEIFRAVDILVLKIKDRMVSGKQTIHLHRVGEGSLLCRHR